VEHLLAALPEAAPDVDVVPYVLSRRARAQAAELPAGTRFLSVPAGVAVRLWGVVDRPSIDRELGDVDVVHGTNFVVPPTRRPSTVTIHDTWCLTHPADCARAVRPFDRAVRRALGRGAWAHVSTEAVATEVRARYRTDRIAVVPFGVPPLGASGPLPDAVGERYILSLNTQDRRKRQAHLVGTFRSVAATEPGVQLVFAGAAGDATESIERAIAALPVDAGARVVRLGPVDDATRAALVRGATVVAYTSADEGFGFPVLEAMVAGVPVVATRVGGIAEVAGDAALLVEVDDDPGPLADALRTVLDDKRTRDLLGERGRARARTFSWTRHAAGMAGLWARAAERARA
jgi:glycosyltransferase involved in cell wall biosynthesis